ncbi:MAG: hypothetical protein FJX64_05810 [Alphaproteobacteria bacterium]|nr:hypothetical protein [Alphaproteobacteria bacterium]
MPTREEVVAAVQGALLLARFDARGMQLFDNSLSGFWRSFFAAVVAVPFTVYWLVVNYHETEYSASWVLFIEAIRYVVGWSIIPLILIPVAKALSRSTEYVPFIIAYNWSMVVQSALTFVLVVVDQTGLLPIEVLWLVSWALVVYLVVYFVFIARVALRVPAYVGAVLAILYYALTRTLWETTRRFL